LKQQAPKSKINRHLFLHITFRLRIQAHHLFEERVLTKHIALEMEDFRVG
jgi:hypothetical protein